MNLDEARIGLEGIAQIYEQFSKNDDLSMPDYVIEERKMEPLHPNGFMSPVVPRYYYRGGNIPADSEKLRWHSGNADGEYLGKFDVIELYSDEQGNVSALTTIHEYIHYRNKHKGIEMTENEVHEEAIETYRKLGY